MARYPTFDEYRKRGNFQDGIKRCDDLLKKSPNDAQLLTVKLQLVYAAGGDGNTILQQLSAIQPPLLDLNELAAIEDAVESSQRDLLPRPSTAGPAVALLWDNAFKASKSTNHKLDLLSLRYSRAAVDNRLLDAQQALIQLKALQPKNRVIYMAHAAVTQLLSSNKDDLQSRLALSLARKAVKENFDDDNALDCRVPGQIFALQASEADLKNLAGRSFAQSKQVYDAVKSKAAEAGGDSTIQSHADPASLPPAQWLLSEVESLKQQFARLIASSAPMLSIVAFAANSTRLFHTAKTSIPDPRGRGLANACFLSVSALVRIFEMSAETHSLFHAAFLVEILLKHSPHVHEARLILVYLYMKLGLGSLALRMFDSLNVKEIQHDTVGHVLFTRLSITHPHSTRGPKDVLDPQKRLSHALSVYTRHEEKLAETEASVLNHEQTGMIFDLRQLRGRLCTSVTRRIIYLEQRRVSRLVQDTSGDNPARMGPRLTANWLDVTDNRDLAATFDFGYNVETALHSSRNGIPGASWILSCLTIDCAWCVTQMAEMPVKDPQVLLDEVSKLGLYLDRLEIGDGESVSEGTLLAEMRGGDLAYHVLRFLLNLASSAEDLHKSVKNVLQAVKSLDIESLTPKSALLTEGLREHYIYLDVLRIVVRACKYATEKTQECHEELQQVRTLSEGHCSSLLKHAEQQAKRINRTAVKTHLLQDERIDESAKLFGHDEVTDFSTLIADSAQEGWEGLPKITIA